MPAGFCDSTDQRGIARPQPGSDDCDVGAYQYAPPTLSSASPGSGLVGSSVTLTGTNLIGVTGITLAGAAATVTAHSDTSMISV
jgi:large repetitive protein